MEGGAGAAAGFGEWRGRERRGGREERRDITRGDAISPRAYTATSAVLLDPACARRPRPGPGGTGETKGTQRTPRGQERRAKRAARKHRMANDKGHRRGGRRQENANQRTGDPDVSRGRSIVVPCMAPVACGPGPDRPARGKPGSSAKSERKLRGERAQGLRRANEEGRGSSGRTHTPWFRGIPLAAPGPPVGRSRRGRQGSGAKSERNLRRERAQRLRRANKEGRGQAVGTINRGFLGYRLPLPGLQEVGRGEEAPEAAREERPEKRRTAETARHFLR